MNHRGYLVYYVTINKKCKRIRYHRSVWEKHNGEIPAGYDIHHKNGDKLDNRLENLEAMHHNEHAVLHRNQKN